MRRQCKRQSRMALALCQRHQSHHWQTHTQHACTTDGDQIGQRDRSMRREMEASRTALDMMARRRPRRRGPGVKSDKRFGELFAGADNEQLRFPEEDDERNVYSYIS